MAEWQIGCVIEGKTTRGPNLLAGKKNFNRTAVALGAAPLVEASLPSERARKVVEPIS